MSPSTYVARTSVSPVVLCLPIFYFGMFRLLGTLLSSVSRTHLLVFWLRPIVLRLALTPTSCRLSTYPRAQVWRRMRNYEFPASKLMVATN